MNEIVLIKVDVIRIPVIDKIEVKVNLQPKEEKESFIGKRMIVRDNSYTVLCDNKSVSGRLFGCIVEIVSEPYDEEVDVLRTTYTHKFVKVRSLDSGLFYRVMFNKDDIVRSEKEQQFSVYGRQYRVNDNSYSKLCGTNIHPFINGKTLTIISEPYIEKDDEFGNNHIFVSAMEKSGNIYRVLFNEDGLI